MKYSYEDSRGIVSEPPEFKVDFYGQKEIFSLIEDEDNINDNGKSPLVCSFQRQNCPRKKTELAEAAVLGSEHILSSKRS